jgi:hypothetical protein
VKALRFEETMTGTWTPSDGDATARAFEFTVTAVGKDMKRLAQEGRFQIQGRVRAQELAEDSELTGALEVHPITDRELLYAFYFKADDGRRLFYQGRKNISLKRLMKSMTTLNGVLYHGKEVVGTSVVHFDLSDIPSFLASFRIADPEPAADIPEEVRAMRPDSCAPGLADNEVSIEDLKRRID